MIANRLQTDTLKLKRLWQETAQAISKLPGTPDSVKALRKAVGDLRSAFNEYQLIWVSLMDFTTLTLYGSLPLVSWLTWLRSKGLGAKNLTHHASPHLVSRPNC